MNKTRFSPSRRLRATQTSAGALLVAGTTLVTLAVVNSGAATLGGGLTLVDPASSKSFTGPQAGSTQFNVSVPAGASCPGSTATTGYRVYSFMVPTGTDPTTVSFASGTPSTGLGYFDTFGTYVGPLNTGSKGEITGVPNNLSFAGGLGGAYTVNDLTGGSTKSWISGLACADKSGKVTDYWSNGVTFSTSSADPKGFTFTTAASTTGTTTSSSSSSSSSTSSTSSTSTSTSTTSTTADTTTTLDPSSTTTTVDPNSPTTVADAASGSTSTTVCVRSTTSTTQAARTTTTTAGATTTTASGVTTTTAAPASTTSTVGSATANATCSSANSNTSSTLGGAAAVKGDLIGGGTASSPAASGSSAAQSTLPFTGLPGDKAVGLGIFLIGAGLALVVAAHRRQELERMMWPDQV